jgi:hypothetical protein
MNRLFPFVGSNPTRGMDVCVRLFCVCAVLCACSGLATGCSPVQGVLPIVYRITKLKKRPGPNTGPQSHVHDTDVLSAVSVVQHQMQCAVTYVAYRQMCTETASPFVSTDSVTDSLEMSASRVGAGIRYQAGTRGFSP